MFSTFMNVFFVPVLEVDYGVVSDLVDEGVVSYKCSSSGGYIVYMQHMILSLSTRVHGGQSVHGLSENSLTQAVYRQATMSSHRE